MDFVVALPKILLAPPGSIRLRPCYGQDRGLEVVRCLGRARLGGARLGRSRVGWARLGGTRSYIFFCFFSLKYLGAVLIQPDLSGCFFVTVDYDLAFAFGVALLDATELRLADVEAEAELAFEQMNQYPKSGLLQTS